MNYFKILHAIQGGDKTAFDVSVAYQRQFLNSLGEPIDNIDRGYKQYCCQNFFVSKWKIILLNVVAGVLLPFVTLLFLFKRLLSRRGAPIGALIENKGMDETIPSEIISLYHPEKSCWKEGASMGVTDLLFLKKLFLRAPHHPFFILKALMNVVYYSDMIYKHSPKVMIQYGEFSFNSSILTEYCHRHSIMHIDIMHGEKLWFIRDAFFKYDKCYVWDNHYVDLFRDLKAFPDQFVVAVPPSMHIECTRYEDKSLYADYKYFLAEFDEKQLESIVKSMSFVIDQGKSVVYRPHPRYSNMNILKKYISEDNIEMPKDISIMKSISNLEYAVGSYTTVLNQAYFSGKKIILDDVTFKNQYEKLKTMKYILSEKETELLSNKQN